MASKVLTVPIGRDLIAAPGNGWQIAGIRIDNPSGSWLHVEGIDVFVPPYTSGWSYDLTPSQLAVTVRWTNSPSGSLSSQVGGAATVELFDTPVGVFEGNPTGAGARVSIVPVSLIAFDFCNTGLFNNPLILISASDTRRLVIQKFTITYDLTSVRPPSGNMLAQWRGPVASSWFQGISPETPYATDSFVDGSMIVNPGQDLIVEGFSEAGASWQYFLASVHYYEEAI